jgi:hypothetical protein
MGEFSKDWKDNKADPVAQDGLTVTVVQSFVFLPVSRCRGRSHEAVARTQRALAPIQPRLTAAVAARTLLFVEIVRCVFLAFLV